MTVILLLPTVSFCKEGNQVPGDLSALPRSDARQKQHQDWNLSRLVLEVPICYGATQEEPGSAAVLVERTVQANAWLTEHM